MQESLGDPGSECQIENRRGLGPYDITLRGRGATMGKWDLKALRGRGGGGVLEGGGYAVGNLKGFEQRSETIRMTR